MGEKIVKLKSYLEIDDEKADDIKESDLPKKSKRLFYIIVILMIAFLYFVLSIFAKYRSCDIKAVYQRNDSSETTYEIFGDKLLKLSTDGVFCTTATGDIIYNYTFDMVSPRVNVEKEYAVVYDFLGKDVMILSQNGYEGGFKTTAPISMADVGAKGTVALLMQGDGVSYIQILDVKGTVLSAGQIFPENSGIPISLALSSDAKKMVVSVINMSGGEVKSMLYFYNFGEEGKESVDNIVAVYTYADMLVPKVTYVDGDRVVAFGDSQIIEYNNDVNCSVAKEVFSTTEINSIFYAGKYYGYIKKVVNEDAQVVNQISLYNTSGMECYVKEFSDSYEKVYLYENGELLLTDGRTAIIYNRFGVRKFEYTFDTEIYRIIQKPIPKEYVVIGEQENKEIRIKWDR